MDNCEQTSCFHITATYLAGAVPNAYVIGSGENPQWVPGTRWFLGQAGPRDTESEFMNSPVNLWAHSWVYDLNSDLMN